MLQAHRNAEYLFESESSRDIPYFEDTPCDSLVNINSMLSKKLQ